MRVNKQTYLRALKRTLDHPSPCTKCVATVLVLRETTVNFNVDTRDVCYWCYKLINKMWFPKIRAFVQESGYNCPCDYLGKEEAIERGIEVLEEEKK